MRKTCPKCLLQINKLFSDTFFRDHIHLILFDICLPLKLKNIPSSSKIFLDAANLINDNENALFSQKCSFKNVQCSS